MGSPLRKIRKNEEIQFDNFEFIIHFIWLAYSTGRIGNRLLDDLGTDRIVLFCMGDSFAEKFFRFP